VGVISSPALTPKFPRTFLQFLVEIFVLGCHGLRKSK
jgi:hypothetical protein